MRVCFFSRRYFPAVSGMSVYAYNFIRGMRDLGHEITMLSQYRGDAPGIAIYGGGTPPPTQGVRTIGFRSKGEELAPHGQPADFERDLNELVSACIEAHRERPFDILHAQYAYPTGLAALIAGERLGLPVIVSIQGGDGHWVGLCCETHRRAMQAVLDHANAVIIGCKSFRDEVIGNHGTDAERFTIVPGAVSTSRFFPSQRPENTPLRLLFHGRADRRKGLIDTLESWKLLCERNVAFEGVVSGVGPDLDEAEHFVAANGLEEKVEIMGAADYSAVPSIYRQCDLFVTPTYAEGFSNTVLEAMASGLPVIGGRAVGVVDAIEHERNGLLVEPGDATGLADLQQPLIDDKALRERLREAAKRDVTERYSWPVVCRSIEKVYERALGQLPLPDWEAVYDPSIELAQADPTCRFRAAPHLL
ncbi:glycosyltransferase family 4 protein [Parvularcula maris]|uniref:Glycosyltransferase family 4 protein n=1 Tax=Parvularcula maris TaxID=2965077 RepID=A0A9X2RJF9_9PROT|nr:glycosyltransferase family 4 protein [Parvularcula maris]MCQ8184668.1 glycosyltransferase family 4 protein [Parvularcula maris]